VEVWWKMLVKIHADHDTKKAANFRHITSVCDAAVNWDGMTPSAVARRPRPKLRACPERSRRVPLSGGRVFGGVQGAELLTMWASTDSFDTLFQLDAPQRLLRTPFSDQPPKFVATP
jgi:hypothetical protein